MKAASGVTRSGARLSCFRVSQRVSGLSCDLQSSAGRLCAVQEVCKDIPTLPRILGAENHIKGRKQNRQRRKSCHRGQVGRQWLSYLPPSLSLPSLLFFLLLLISLPSHSHLLYLCCLSRLSSLSSHPFIFHSSLLSLSCISSSSSPKIKSHNNTLLLLLDLFYTPSLSCMAILSFSPPCFLFFSSFSFLPLSFSTFYHLRLMSPPHL